MRERTINISGPGAAHGAGSFGFGRRPMLCNEVDGGGGSYDVDVSDLGGDGGNAGGAGGQRVTFTAEQQRVVNQLVARARADGRRNPNNGNGQQQQQQRQQQQPSGDGGSDRLSRLEGLVEGLVTAMRPPEQQQPKPPTAPMPPGGKVPDYTNAQGLVDVYRLTPEAFGQLTPQQIVDFHQRAVNAARMQQGAPPLPMQIRGKGGR